MDWYKMTINYRNTYSVIKLRSAAVGLFLLFSLSLPLLIGCDKPTEKSPFNIIDTGFWVSPTSNEQTWWLDNDRILFPSSKDLIPDSLPNKIKVWSLSTGQMVSSNLDSVICVREGQVFYGVKNESANKMATFFRGPLDNAREHPNPDGSDSMFNEDHTMVIDENFDCDWVSRVSASPYPPPKGGPYRYKLRGENYLEILKPNTQIPKDKIIGGNWAIYYAGLDDQNGAIYHADPAAPGKKVPFYDITYSEYLDAYVVSNGVYEPARPDRSSFFILKRNGDLKEVPYPQTLFHGEVTMYPVKQGYLVQYNSGRTTETDPGDRGLYLMQGEKVERLIVGSIHGVSISPDGCKVAFVHARNTKEYFSRTKPYRTLKVINLEIGGHHTLLQMFSGMMSPYFVQIRKRPCFPVFSFPPTPSLIFYGRAITNR
jgi:hypothetical protein